MMILAEDAKEAQNESHRGVLQPIFYEGSCRIVEDCRFSEDNQRRTDGGRTEKETFALCISSVIDE